MYSIDLVPSVAIPDTETAYAERNQSMTRKIHFIFKVALSYSQLHRQAIAIE